MEVIAEIGQNHNGDMGLACQLIDAAKEAGADVAKFQLYEARALFPKEGNEWFDYNCRTELSYDNIAMLAERCRSVGIEFMASVFDIERIKWLEQVGIRRYKIASRSIANQALVRAVANTGKRMIVSLGYWQGSSFPNITAVGGVDYLYCVSKYPTALSDLKLESIDFERYSGFSDHTIGINASMAALARGARIIEKHFTLDKAMYGPDHNGSMTPDELAMLVEFRNSVREAL